MINSFYDDDTPTMLHATVSPARNGRTTPVPNLYTDGTFHDFFSNVIVVVAFLSKPYNRRHDDIKILPTYPMHSRSNASAYNSTATSRYIRRHNRTYFLYSCGMQRGIGPSEEFRRTKRCAWRFNIGRQYKCGRIPPTNMSFRLYNK